MIFGVLQRLFGVLSDLTRVQKQKIIAVSTSFGFIIGAYTIIKEMKDVIFVSTVGPASYGLVKQISVILLIPATLLYAKLVDRASRLHLLTIYTMFYGIVGILIAGFLGHPTIGLANTVQSSSRVFGWIVYLLYEGMTPFVVSMFWAFANSVIDPDAAKKGYSIIVVGSKFGGAMTAILGWLLFSYGGFGSWIPISSIAIHQLLLGVSSALLMFAPFFVYRLKRKLPAGQFDGYQATARLEVEKNKTSSGGTGILSGLRLLLAQPYVLGIFGIIFFYESINVVVGYQRLVVLQGAAKTLAAFSGEMFFQRFLMHGIGLLIAFFGTRVIIKTLGERWSILLVPVVIGSLLTYFMLAYDPVSIRFVFVALQTLNYAFSSPLREALYIPTTKDVRFKSKAWIDSFGAKISKMFGSTVITGLKGLVPGSGLFIVASSSFFAVIIGLWSIMAYYLGRRYKVAIEKDEVIGATK